MTAGNLPHPATTSEMYLAAALEELRAIRALLPAAPARTEGEIELREPAPHAGQAGKAQHAKKRG